MSEREDIQVQRSHGHQERGDPPIRRAYLQTGPGQVRGQEARGHREEEGTGGGVADRADLQGGGRPVGQQGIRVYHRRSTLFVGEELSVQTETWQAMWQRRSWKRAGKDSRFAGLTS